MIYICNPPQSDQLSLLGDTAILDPIALGLCSCGYLLKIPVETKWHKSRCGYRDFCYLVTKEIAHLRAQEYPLMKVTNGTDSLQ